MGAIGDRAAPPLETPPEKIRRALAHFLARPGGIFFVVGGAVVGGAVLCGAVVGGAVVGGAVVGGTIVGGTIVGGTIVGGTIVGGTIAGGAIVGGTVVRSSALGGAAAVGGAVVAGAGVEAGFAVPEVADSPSTSVGGWGRAPGVELVVARCDRVVAAPRPLWIDGCEVGCAA